MKSKPPFVLFDRDEIKDLIPCLRCGLIVELVPFFSGKSVQKGLSRSRDPGASLISKGFVSWDKEVSLGYVPAYASSRRRQPLNEFEAFF